MKTMTVPDATLQAKNVLKRELVEIQAGAGSSTVFRFTNHHQPLESYSAIDGYSELHVFQAASFAVGMIAAANQGVESTQITFFDIDTIAKSIGYSYDLNNWPVNIYEVWIDPSDLSVVAGYEPLFIDGRIDGFDADVQGLNDSFTFGVLGSPLDEQVTSPQQEYSISCRHRYKDEMCAAVSGLPDCPRTMEACIERSNLARFGGFPYAPVAGQTFTHGPTTQKIPGQPTWPSEE